MYLIYTCLKIDAEENCIYILSVAPFFNLCNNIFIIARTCGLSSTDGRIFFKLRLEALRSVMTLHAVPQLIPNFRVQ